MKVDSEMELPFIMRMQYYLKLSIIFGFFLVTIQLFAGLELTYELSSSTDIFIDGRSPHKNAGIKVAKIGDVNADGYDDFAITTNYNTLTSTPTLIPTRNRAVAIFFGKPDRSLWSSNLTIRNANLILTTNESNDLFGEFISGGQDVNHDGIDDFAIGAPGLGTDSNPGKVYLIFGRRVFPSRTSLSRLTNKIIFVGERPGDKAGPVALGDLDRNGYAEVIIGAPKHSASDDAEGKIYIFRGKSLRFSADSTINLRSANTYCNAPAPLITDSIDFVEIYRHEGFGSSIAYVGDVDRDGYKEFVVGSPNTVLERNYAYPGTIDLHLYEGAIFVFSGMDLPRISGASYPYRLIIKGPITVEHHFVTYGGPHIGVEVAAAGDVNGDGYRDFWTSGGNFTDTRLFFGSADIFSRPTRAVGELGISLWTFNPNSKYHLSTEGDVNGDGYSDLIIGNPLYQRYYATSSIPQGAAYLYFGLTLGTVDRPDFDILFESKTDNSYTGYSVDFIGDIDHDGFDDIAISAPGYTDGGCDSCHSHSYDRGYIGKEEGLVQIIFGEKSW
ncbi:MAG: hypothetical protein Q8Q33_02590 [Chlamydiota bacterium]|nr:hypothetical protein [Chlamydiota bacterium]